MNQVPKLQGLEFFDVLKVIGSAMGLKDNGYTSLDIFKLDAGCWKVGCNDSKGLYFPMVLETRNFNVGNLKVQAVKEINLVPLVAIGLVALFILKK